jgi:hypothetical protein
MRKVAPLAAIIALALTGCGGSSTTSSSASPQQTDHAQADVGYVRALNQIMAPFSKPPASLTDYAGATRKLQTAIRQLGSLTPPAAFAASQKHLVAGLQKQAALGPRMGRAAAAHNAIALNNLEGKVVAAEHTIRVATREMVDAYNQCRAGNFKTC